AEDPERLETLRRRLAPRVDPASEEVREALRRSTGDAIARGLFGVPTIGIGERLFWGADALEMAAASLGGDPWFDGPHWQREGEPRPGVQRG
ncbi:MAG: DsbA family protein, partial [Burkholderiaceae bacterium]